MSNSVQPHRRQPTRLPHPWDSPGKNTGVGCHFLLQCMKLKSESEVAQSCPILRDRLFATGGLQPPGSSIHGIFQARALEWGAIAFSAPAPSRTLSLTPVFYIHLHTFNRKPSFSNLNISDTHHSNKFHHPHCLSPGHTPILSP